LILHAPAAAGLADGVATQTLSTTDLDDLVASTPARHRAPERARRSTSVMVTSGTTGVPKRVPIGRRAGQPLAAFALAGATRIRPGVPVLVWPPLHTATAGGRCAVPGGWRPGGDGERPARGGLADGAGEAALAAIRRYGVEVVFGVPAQLRRWLRRSPPPTALHPGCAPS